MAQFNETWVEHQRRRWMRTGRSGWNDRMRGFTQPQLLTEESDLDWQTETAIRRARCQLAAASFELALMRLDQLCRKANFNPDQPRVPAGQPGAGQWVEGGGTARTPLAGSPPGIGHNQGPPLDDPPTIPEQRPVAASERNAFFKAAAQWLARAFRIGGPVGYFFSAMEVMSWLDTDRAFIDAYLDPPKTLEELQQAVATWKLGYDVHHIVEQTLARDAEFPEELIDAYVNKVRIPTLKHWEINGWYGKPNDDFGGLSPREYLRDKDWDERVRIGLMALRKYEVLRP